MLAPPRRDAVAPVMMRDGGGGEVGTEERRPGRTAWARGRILCHSPRTPPHTLPKTAPRRASSRTSLQHCTLQLRGSCPELLLYLCECVLHRGFRGYVC